LKTPSPYLLLLLVLTICFTLATSLQPQTVIWGGRTQSDSMLKVLLGDGRRLFANHFFVKADVYFHSGYYPSIFAQAHKESVNARHMVEDHDESDEHEHEHEKAMDFLGQPKDWIDKFGRHFYSSTHSHLDKPDEAREILPWLKLSADLDPQLVDNYTVAAYWLRSRLGKPDEAEQFLRIGLRANPTSYEILYELGTLYYENHHDPIHARNLWELALRRWDEQEKAGKKPVEFTYEQMTTHLARVEEEQGNLNQAVHYRELEKKSSPSPELIQKEIDALKQKIAAQSSSEQAR
jgi:tetratricopeptide (TPR) repeat protein